MVYLLKKGLKLRAEGSKFRLPACHLDQFCEHPGDEKKKSYAGKAIRRMKLLTHSALQCLSAECFRIRPERQAKPIKYHLMYEAIHNPSIELEFRVALFLCWKTCRRWENIHLLRRRNWVVDDPSGGQIRPTHPFHGGGWLCSGARTSSTHLWSCVTRSRWSGWYNTFATWRRRT